MFKSWRYKIQFEYWPISLVYIPTLFYWAYLAFRARALFYMTAANPGIELGGFFGESKSAILDLVPDAYKPKTIQINPQSSSWLDEQRRFGPPYPLVAKPNVGERGNGVEVMHNEEALIAFLHDKTESYLLQEFSTYSYEYGVLFYRMPNEKQGRVISITGKIFMEITGDGHHTIRQLMEANYRYSLQIERLSQQRNLEEVLPAGKKLILEPIGNHCRGTEFTNKNALINQKVHEQFTQIAERMDGFYFGRFDLKAKRELDLETGEFLHIMEVNGTTSEAGHIYSQGFGVLNAYRVIFSQMTLIYKISLENHKRGVAYSPFKEFTSTVWNHFFPKKSRTSTSIEAKQWA